MNLTHKPHLGGALKIVFIGALYAFLFAKLLALALVQDQSWRALPLP
jgi:hypothetical protein